ncbi:MAG: GTPase Era [Anaerolineae bacterium]
MELPLPEELPEGHKSGFVAVIGKPNVGKSTLMNRYVGQKVAIVSPKPQTTRRRILGIRTDERAQIIFVDTPGIHEPLHKLGEVMVETATRAVPDADLILFMIDVSEHPTDEDRQIAEILREHARVLTLLVLNKMDLLAPDEAESRMAAYSDLIEAADALLISATEGTGTDQLLEEIIELLPAGPQYYPPDQVTDQPERVIGAELIREQVLRFTHQEVPHAVAVAVEEWKERREDLTYISANIYVEKSSQKGILIGSKGSMLKRIGRAARQELEHFVGHKVYLELWVKVRKRWRKDENALRWFGYK